MGFFQKGKWKIKGDTLIISGAGDIGDLKDQSSLWSSSGNVTHLFIGRDIYCSKPPFFFKLPALEDVEVQKGNPYLFSENGCLYAYPDYAFKKDRKAGSLLYCPASCKEESFTIYGVPRGSVFQGCKNVKNVILVNCPDDAETLSELCAGSSIVQIAVHYTDDAGIWPDRMLRAENGVLFNHDMRALIAYPPGKKDAEYRVPDTVTSLRKRAFQFTGELKRVTLPEGLREIPEYAFYRSGIQSLDIPPSVESFGTKCFSSSALRFVDVPPTVKTPDLIRCFDSCFHLQAIVVHNREALQIGYRMWPTEMYEYEKNHTVDYNDNHTVICYDKALLTYESLAINTKIYLKNVSFIGEKPFPILRFLNGKYIFMADTRAFHPELLNCGEMKDSGMWGKGLLFTDSAYDRTQITINDALSRWSRERLKKELASPSVPWNSEAFMFFKDEWWGFFDKSFRQQAFDESERWNFDEKLPLINEKHLRTLIPEQECPLPVIDDGAWDRGIRWRYFENGLLFISGEGEILPVKRDLLGELNPHAYPWYGFPSDWPIRTVVIDSGVKTVGAFAFSNLPELEKVVIGRDVRQIHNGAFCGNPKLGPEIVIPASVECLYTPEEYEAYYAEEMDGRGFEAFLLPRYGGVFADCPALQEIRVETAPHGVYQTFRSENGVLYADSAILQYPAGKSRLDCFSVGDAISDMSKTAFCGASVDRLDLGRIFSIEKEGLRGLRCAEYAVSPENASYVCENGIIYSRDLTRLVACPSNKRDIVIGENVKKIECAAFERNECGDLTVPAGVEEIGAIAFFGAVNRVLRFACPAAAMKGNYILDGCRALTALYLPADWRGEKPLMRRNSGAREYLLRDIYISAPKAEMERVDFTAVFNGLLKSFTVHCADGDLTVEPEAPQS